MRKSSIDIRTSTRLKGTALAVALAALSFSVGVQARGLIHPVDPDYTGRVSVTGVAYPGETVDVAGRGFKPGQQVQLLSDGATITTQAILNVDAEGRIAGQVEIPPESPVGIHPVVVQTVNPGYAEILDFKISPKLPFTGVNAYHIARAPLNPGLYQGAYSARSHAVYVTSAVGRAPNQQSSLMKVNPSSLAIEHQVTPPADSTGKGLEAVYGVAVDDTTGTVWTGNTRTGAVAVYKQVAADVAILQTTLDVASDEIGYAASDTSVEEWARVQGLMIKPGDIAVFPLPGTPLAPTATQVPSVEPVEYENWQVWYSLIFE